MGRRWELLRSIESLNPTLLSLRRKKYGKEKGIAYLCVIVLVMAAVGYFLSRDHIHLASIKAEVVQEYIKLAGSEEEYAKHPIVWFDENGGKREGGVYRYFGTYGDCIVCLTYGWPVEDGTEIQFYSYYIDDTRSLMLPSGYAIYVVNRDPNCKTVEFWPTARLAAIQDAATDLNWLTELEFDRIARDLEAWFAAGNY